MSAALYTALAIGIAAFCTALCRALPFIVFGGRREVPRIVTYLGTVLPAAIMIILIVYCLRNTNYLSYPYGLAETISVLLVAALQKWKRNAILSMLIGTACYMILLRFVF